MKINKIPIIFELNLNNLRDGIREVAESSTYKEYNNFVLEIIDILLEYNGNEDLLNLMQKKLNE